LEDWNQGKYDQKCAQNHQNVKVTYEVKKWLHNMKDGFTNHTDVPSVYMDVCSTVEDANLMCKNKLKNARMSQNV